MMQTKPLQLRMSKIKLNRRGLSELVLACAFLSLLTWALWSWQTNGTYVAATGTVLPEPDRALMPQIFRHPAIMLSAVVTEFILLLAFVLALVPISWWLRTERLIPGENEPVMTPLRWLGELLGILPSPTRRGPGQYIMNEDGELVFVPLPADGEENPDQPAMVMVQQADGTMVMVPADPQKQAATKEGDPSTEPILPTPEQTSDILNFDDEEEEDPLSDLANLKDIMASAFDEDSAIDPEREALSRELEEIDITALLKNARQVLATFNQ